MNDEVHVGDRFECPVTGVTAVVVQIVGNDVTISEPGIPPYFSRHITRTGLRADSDCWHPLPREVAASRPLLHASGLPPNIAPRPGAIAEAKAKPESLIAALDSLIEKFDESRGRVPTSGELLGASPPSAPKTIEAGPIREWTTTVYVSPPKSACDPRCTMGAPCRREVRTCARVHGQRAAHGRAHAERR